MMQSTAKSALVIVASLLFSSSLQLSSAFSLHALTPAVNIGSFQPRVHHANASASASASTRHGSTLQSTLAQDEDVIATTSKVVDTAPRIPRGVHAPITVLRSPQDLADFLNNDDEDDDRICVLKFHANWCKSCQKMGLKFQSFVNEHGDWVQGQERYASSSSSSPLEGEESEERELLKEGNYRFASIELGANKDMCKQLQITRLPFVHLYAGGKQLSGFPCGPSKFYRLREQLDYQQQVQSGSTSSTSTESSFAVRPITATTFTPELLAEMIANDTSGELKP